MYPNFVMGMLHNEYYTGTNTYLKIQCCINNIIASRVIRVLAATNAAKVYRHDNLTRNIPVVKFRLLWLPHGKFTHNGLMFIPAPMHNYLLTVYA